VTAPAAVPPRLERVYRVRFDEAGPDGHLRSSGFLRFAQDLAWIHSEVAGFGRDWYNGRQLTWLVHAIELDVLADVPYGCEIVVSTEVIGLRRVWVRRRSEFRALDEERLNAVAVTDWVLLNARGFPTRVPTEIVEVLKSPPGNFAPLRVGPATPPPTASARAFHVRRSELDPMAHVNNAAYLDYLDEQFLGDDRARHRLPIPRRYRAEFLASAEPQRNLTGQGWREDHSWSYRLTDDGGRELFRARLEADPASWVGG
jgi:acyl-ACP thioesterase